MNLNLFLMILLGLAYIGATIYVANQEDTDNKRGQSLRWLLYGVTGLVFVVAVMVLQMAFVDAESVAPTAETALPSIDPAAAWVNFGLAVISCGVSAGVIASVRVRQTIQRLLGPNVSYNPGSSVHTTAIVLILAVLSVQIGQFVLSGGLSGLAEDIELTGVSPIEPIFNATVFTAVALLGVGLTIRRVPQAALKRLGLRLPTREDTLIGILGGVGLLVLAYFVAVIWALVVTPEQFAEQTAASNQLAQAINTLTLAFIISSMAAIGEEIFFRGALQPVFGLIPTSAFFALVHTQYTFTPAAGLIWIVALGLGWVRQRYSTSAAIIAHFVYNFVPLSLALLLEPLVGGA